MNLNSIFERAARLCGFAEDYYKKGDSSELAARALSAINSTLFDLCEEPEHESLLDTLSVSESVFDAAVYGTAMYLSLAFGDTDRASVFSKIYSGRRAAVKGGLSAVKDRLPGTGASL